MKTMSPFSLALAGGAVFALLWMATYRALGWAFSPAPTRGEPGPTAANEA